MRGRDFLDSARALAGLSSEAHWRSAAGRAYYALLHEARAALESWGVSPPPKDRVHSVVRLKFSYSSDLDAKEVGLALEKLVALRNWADYRLDSVGDFVSNHYVLKLIELAASTIALLDAIEADPARRANAIASLPARP